jgi:hypothetical protein
MAAALLLTLMRAGHAVALSGIAARQICYQGGWACIPGYELRWQVALGLR